MAKKTTTLRVHKVAKELGVSSKDIIAKCEAEGIPDITNHMSAISLGLSQTIKEWFSAAAGNSTTSVETAAPVDVEKARKKAKRTTKKVIKKDDDDATDVLVVEEVITTAVVDSPPEIVVEVPPEVEELPAIAAEQSEPSVQAIAEPVELETDVKDDVDPNVVDDAGEPVMNIPNRPRRSSRWGRNWNNRRRLH